MTRYFRKQPYRSRKSKKCHRKCKRKSKKDKCGLKKTKKSTNLNAQRLAEYLNNEKIKEHLNCLLEKYPNNIQVETIGNSKEGRAIYLVFISNNCGELPKNAVFIEAGSNGEDLIAVASALYIIDYLCKNASTSKTLTVMDYFVIPCTNPDAYELTLNGRKPKVNLATSFPFTLGQSDLEVIDEEKFLKASKKWKENYDFDSPERSILINAIASFRFAIKLFISLQEGGEKIVYPFGMAMQDPYDVEDLAWIAKMGRSGCCKRFQIGSIYQHYGLTFGTIIDFLRLFSDSLKFTYIIHLNDRKNIQRFDEVPERAENVLCCITLMAKNVFDHYNIEQREVTPPEKIVFINKIGDDK